MRFRLRFSLRTMLLLVPVFGLGAAWVGRSEQQKRAVAALRKLDRYECVFYNFEADGCCAGNAPRKFEPPWLLESIGVDYFFNARNVFLDADDLEVALPHLKRLPRLAEIWVSGRENDVIQYELPKTKAAIERIKREFPHVTVDEHPGCPIVFGPMRVAS